MYLLTTSGYNAVLILSQKRFQVWLLSVVSGVSLGTPIIVGFSFLEQHGPYFLPLRDAWVGLMYLSKKPFLLSGYHVRNQWALGALHSIVTCLNSFKGRC